MLCQLSAAQLSLLLTKIFHSIPTISLLSCCERLHDIDRVQEGQQLQEKQLVNQLVQVQEDPNFTVVPGSVAGYQSMPSTMLTPVQMQLERDTARQREISTLRAQECTSNRSTSRQALLPSGIGAYVSLNAHACRLKNLLDKYLLLCRLSSAKSQACLRLVSISQEL